MATASIASAVTVGVISYNKSNDKNATVQENVPAVEEVPVNADQPIDGVGEDTETTDAPEDENGSENMLIFRNLCFQVPCVMIKTILNSGTSR